jgi:hypothetical protein
MEDMNHLVKRLVGAISPLDELIPAVEGWIQAKRVMEWDELSEEQHEQVELFFELAMEHLSEKMTAAKENVDIRTTDLIKAAYDGPDDSPNDDC